jgi:hypothetical protein
MNSNSRRNAKFLYAFGVNDATCTVHALTPLARCMRGQLHQMDRKSVIKKPNTKQNSKLARESGAQGDCLMKKTEGRKSRDTVP